jgi:hypothetical protein
MGLFKKLKGSMGYHDEKLRERGTEGTAKVSSVKKTHWTAGDDASDTPIYEAILLVTVPGSEPYEVKYRAEGAFKEGADYQVFVDPKDPENIFVDRGEKEAMRRASDALAQLSGQPVESDLGSIAQAAGSLQAGAMPGLGADWRESVADTMKAQLQYVKDPAQRKMMIEQWRKAGISVDDVDPAP